MPIRDSTVNLIALMKFAEHHMYDHGSDKYNNEFKYYTTRKKIKI
jgi:hypothetical protein